MSKQIRNITNHSTSCQSLGIISNLASALLRQSVLLLSIGILSSSESVKFFIQWLILIPGCVQAEGLSFSSINDTFLINSAIKIFIVPDRIGSDWALSSGQFVMTELSSNALTSYTNVLATASVIWAGCNFIGPRERSKQGPNKPLLLYYNRCTQKCQKNHHFWESSKAREVSLST